MKYNASLDGFRALAIVLVMLFHFHYLVELGWIGVQLFFVLSGFLITSILLESKEKKLSNYLKRFYWRRSLRIFPLYYFYLALAIGAFLIFKVPKDLPQDLPFLLTYTFNYQPLVYGFSIDPLFTHFWSLAVEEQFYMIWPLIVYFCSIKQLRWVILGAIVGAPIFRFWVYQSLEGSMEAHHLGEIIYRLGPSQLDAFAYGAILPIMPRGLRKLSPKFLLILTLTLFGIFGLFNFYLVKNASLAIGLSSLGYPIGGTQNFQVLWSYSLVNMVGMALIWQLTQLEDRHWFRKILAHPWPVAIGKVSYGMYVYHWIILFAFNKVLMDFMIHPLIIFPVYFMITYFISWLSFHSLEMPFIHLKDRKFHLNRFSHAQK